MKLNHDCMRDVMLHLESSLVMSVDDDGSVDFEESSLVDISEALKDKWGQQDVAYSLVNLSEAGYLRSAWSEGDDAINEFCVYRITFSGHEFIDTVRDEKHWGAIKAAALAIRDFSLQAMGVISQGMANGAVTAYLSQTTSYL